MVRSSCYRCLQGDLFQASSPYQHAASRQRSVWPHRGCVSQAEGSILNRHDAVSRRWERKPSAFCNLSSFADEIHEAATYCRPNVITSCRHSTTNTAIVKQTLRSAFFKQESKPILPDARGRQIDYTLTPSHVPPTPSFGGRSTASQHS